MQICIYFPCQYVINVMVGYAFHFMLLANMLFILFSSCLMDIVMQDFKRPSNEINLIPQHNYKLDANSMNSRQKGEVSKLFHKF